MILDIDKITLELVRGDTFELPLPINCGSREEFIPYFLSPDDFLYIGIMKPSQPFEHAEVRAMLDCRSPKDSFGNVIFILQSCETEKLEPGKYYISVKLQSGNRVSTLIDNKIFFVTGSSHCC